MPWVNGIFYYNIPKSNIVTGQTYNFRSFVQLLQTFSQIDARIFAEDIDNVLSQSTDAFNLTILSDGSHSMKANLNMGAYRITNILDGINLNDAVSLQQANALNASAIGSLAPVRVGFGSVDYIATGQNVVQLVSPAVVKVASVAGFVVGDTIGWQPNAITNRVAVITTVDVVNNQITVNDINVFQGVQVGSPIYFIFLSQNNNYVAVGMGSAAWKGFAVGNGAVAKNSTAIGNNVKVIARNAVAIGNEKLQTGGTTNLLANAVIAVADTPAITTNTSDLRVIANISTAQYIAVDGTAKGDSLLTDTTTYSMAVDGVVRAVAIPNNLSIPAKLIDFSRFQINGGKLQVAANNFVKYFRWGNNGDQGTTADNYTVNLQTLLGMTAIPVGKKINIKATLTRGGGGGVQLDYNAGILYGTFGGYTFINY
ncbi:MAG: hypothetical protein ORN98_04425, partial [Alphaproteobacteria bacterium]|nr:hypothetical protein [Alphaproteobacteria bacterium]